MKRELHTVPKKIRKLVVCSPHFSFHGGTKSELNGGGNVRTYGQTEIILRGYAINIVLLESDNDENKNYVSPIDRDYDILLSLCGASWTMKWNYNLIVIAILTFERLFFDFSLALVSIAARTTGCCYVHGMRADLAQRHRHGCDRASNIQDVIRQDSNGGGSSSRSHCQPIIRQKLTSSSRRSMLIVNATSSQTKNMFGDLPTVIATLVVSFGIVTFSPSSVYAATDMTTTPQWDLMNGNVQLPNQLDLKLPGTSSSTSEKLVLSAPTLIGAGGGGAVFAFEDSSKLIKISWSKSTQSVLQECQTLQYLKTQQVTATEQCLATYDYPYDKDRAMILVEPYVKDAVASVIEIDGGSKARINAVQQIIQTLVQMLAANTITIDVQPLINPTTGDVVFIDMTEAQILPNAPPSFKEKAVITAFVSEMAALIPDEYSKEATKALIHQMQILSHQRGIVLPNDIIDILESQFEL